MHMEINNTMQTTLKYFRLVDCKRGHLQLPTAIHYNHHLFRARSTYHVQYTYDVQTKMK